MLALDRAILDHLYQPLSDRLDAYARISCFDAARSVAVGAIAMRFIYSLVEAQRGTFDWVSVLILIVMLSIPFEIFRKTERAARIVETGGVNPLVVEMIFSRVLWAVTTAIFCFMFGLIVSFGSLITVTTILPIIEVVLIVSAYYFASCGRPRMIIRRRQFAGA